MGEKIKVIYDEEKIIDPEALKYSIPSWFNEVIEKTVDELTPLDIGRCIRNKYFLDSAYKMLIVHLLNDPYIGDFYEGELMEEASEMDKKYLIQYTDELKEIVKRGYEFIADESHWDFEEDKINFTNIVKKLEDAIEAASASI